MTSSINENDISQQYNCITYQNTNKKIIPLKESKKEKRKIDEEKTSFSSDKNLNNNNSNEKSVIDNNSIKIEYNNINDEGILDIPKEKNKIFQVNYRIKHDGDSKDNIKQSIVTNFINFIVNFINFIIRKKTNNESIKFRIGYQLKNKIKLENFIELTVEELLSFKQNCNNKNKSYDIKEEKIENNINIKKIRELIGVSLDKLFETKLIDLFKDIYMKDIINDNDKNIDLKEYGLEGIILNLKDDDIPTYQKLKDKFKDNKTKIKIMDDIINIKLINPQKPNMFKIEKFK